MAIYSLQIEKHVLAGLIKYPKIYTDISPYVNKEDFYDDIHSTIFLVIKSCADKNESWNKVTLAEKIKNIGISFKDEINIYEYLDNLNFLTITEPAAVDATKELKKIRIRREIEKVANNMLQFVKTNGNLSAEEIVGGVDAIYGEKISLYDPEDKPRNLFEGMNEMVEERGNNPIEEVGLITPHPEFNRYYGGLKPQNIYAFASRPGQGKTTMLEDLALKTSIINDTKAFVCDTEMSTKDIQWRTAAARSSVPQWYLETGQWRKNEEMTKKFRDSKPKNQEYADKQYITHYSVANKNLDQVISIIRRWHKANIKPGQVAIIVYDYLKLSIGESVDKNWAEYQVLGQKIDRLKRLSEELNCVFLTAIQMNRSGENHNRKGNAVIDDATALAISDRLQWVGSFVAIFRRKTLDEIALDGQRFGSHKLIPIKTRFQGREAAGHHDLVRRLNADSEYQYENNYLNFVVNNFDCEEIGSLRTIIDFHQHEVPPDENPNDGNPL